MPGKRTFTIESSCINVVGGRYKSDTPNGTAKKVASKLFRKASKSQKYKAMKKMRFCIRETTSGSDKKTYEYTATRVKLAKPVVRVLNGVNIVNKYKITVTSCKPKVAKTSAKATKSPIKKVRKTKKGGNCNTCTKGGNTCTKGGDCGCDK